VPTGTVPLVFDTATVVVPLEAARRDAHLGSAHERGGAWLLRPRLLRQHNRIGRAGNAEQGAALAYASDHHRSAVGIAHVFIWVAITLSIVIRLSEIALRL
jgi:hypothetical protein